MGKPKTLDQTDHLNLSLEDFPGFGSGSPFLRLDCSWLIFLVKFKLRHNETCKSAELIPSFMKRITQFVFACFQDTLKLGMEQGLEGQSKGRRQGDFTNNSEI